MWDRYNTNNAAIRMIKARPLFGFGWQTFPTTGPDYMRQADTYPITKSTLEVHNVFLSHAAELGLVGSILWLGAFLSAVGGALLRRGPPELRLWRIGLLAIFAAFVSVAMFGPLSYPFPNALMWTWAGIAGAPYFLGEPDPPSHAEGPAPDHAVHGRGKRPPVTEPPGLDLRRVLVVSPHLDDAAFSCAHCSRAPTTHWW